MFFQNMPKILYPFDVGNGVMQDITRYSEVIDKVRANASFYQDYYIQHGERPDHVAYQLYNNPQLHWTLYLLNPQIRESGWPLTDLEVLAKVKKDYPHTVLNTTSDITDKFKVGQIVTGQRSGAGGVVVDKNVDLGQLVIETSDTFKNDDAPESITSVVGEQIETIEAQSAVPQHLSTRHYLQDGEVITSWIDLKPTPAETIVTQYDFYVKSNNQLKQISVIRPESIRQVVDAVSDALRT
jgi:hypothetical protein